MLLYLPRFLSTPHTLLSPHFSKCLSCQGPTLCCTSRAGLHSLPQHWGHGSHPRCHPTLGPGCFCCPLPCQHQISSYTSSSCMPTMQSEQELTYWGCSCSCTHLPATSITIATACRGTWGISSDLMGLSPRLLLLPQGLLGGFLPWPTSRWDFLLPH